MWDGRRNEGEKGETSTFYLSAAINLNNANPTVGPARRPIDPHNPTHPHPLVQRVTSSEIDQVLQDDHVRRRPGHLLVHFLEIDTRSAQRKGEPGAVLGEREGCGRWRSDYVEHFRRISDLEPEISTVRRAAGLDQELCKESISTSVHYKRYETPRVNKQTQLCRENTRFGTMDGRDRI